MLRVVSIRSRHLPGKALLGTSEGQQVAPGFLEFSMDNKVDSKADNTCLSVSIFSVLFIASFTSAMAFGLDLVRLGDALLPLAGRSFEVFFRFILK